MKGIFRNISIVFLLIALLFSGSCLIYNKFLRDQSHPKVELGIDNIDNYMKLFDGKQVGLITNATGVDSNFESTIDILNEKVNLTTLFAPEHGIRGSADAGISVENEIDEKTLLPVYSLYDDTKKPSPNLPTPNTSVVYSGTCLFEGTNVSEGRGTTRPFEIIGAPWINGAELTDTMNQAGLEGVYFCSISFTPTTSKYENEACQGVELHLTNRDTFDSVKTALTLLYTIRDLYPDDFKYLETNFIDKLTGGDYIRTGTYSLTELYQMCDESSKRFKKESAPYYLY